MSLKIVKVKLISFSALGFSIASPAILANELRPVAELREVMTQEVPVSGSGMISGIEFLDIDASRARMNFQPHVFLGTNLTAPTTFCVSVKSSDGRYSAENEFSGVPPLAGGWIPINYRNSRFLSDLKDWSIKNRLAIAITQGKCSEKHLSMYLPASIQKPTRNLNQISLSVSSLAAIGVQAGIQLPDGEQVRASCSRIEDAQTTGFDYRCLMTLPASATEGESSKPLNLRVMRRSQAGGKEIEQVSILPVKQK